MFSLLCDSDTEIRWVYEVVHGLGLVSSHDFLANGVPLALKDPQCLHISVE